MRDEGRKEEGKVGGVWECRNGRSGLVDERERERKKKPSCERTHNSVKNWKVAMPYPPGQCPDKYFRRKKA